MSNLVPLERLTAPAELDGSDSSLRHQHSTVLTANNDLEAVEYWLAQYEDNAHTHRGFKREIERLMLWALYERRKALSLLNGEDLKAYRDFLLSPPPEWCYTSGRAPRRDSPDWRPLGGPLKQSSVMTAMNTIRALYTFLLENGYISISPFAQKGLSRVIKKDAKRQFKKERDNVHSRALKDNSLDCLIEEALAMPTGSARENFKRERAIFILQFGIFLAPRLSEMANAKMGDFRLDLADKWWWRVIGKGDKEEDVPVRNEMLEALSNWRNAISKYSSNVELSALPVKDEVGPVLRRIDGRTAISSSSIYAVIKELADRACDRLDINTIEFQQLRNMSPHWLRHTAITQLANAKTRERYLQAFARHSKRETTEIYITDDTEKFHDSINGLPS